MGLCVKLYIATGKKIIYIYIYIYDKVGKLTLQQATDDHSTSYYI